VPLCFADFLSCKKYSTRNRIDLRLATCDGIDVDRDYNRKCNGDDHYHGAGENETVQNDVANGLCIECRLPIVLGHLLYIVAAMTTY
jgi:hypothetical protein